MAASTTWPRLDPAQQKLLLSALSSNKKRQQSFFESGKSSSNKDGGLNATSATKIESNSNGFDPSVLSSGPSPPGDNTGPGIKSYDNGQFADFGNSAFDFDLGLGASGMGQPNDYFGFDAQDFEGDGGEKRKSPDEDDDDDEAIVDGDPRRRGSEDGPSKKPGRKPLTTEPTTKRKAQNRAAQRAFRERKEKHVKDLELKVADLEKASESANHENGVLRAQVDRLQDQLKGYKRQLSFGGGNVGISTSRSSSLQTFPGSLPDFEFDFPTFGAMPGSQMQASTSGSPQSAGITNGHQTQSPTSISRDNSNESGSATIGSSFSSMRSMNGYPNHSLSSSMTSKAQTAGNGMFGGGFFDGMPPSSIECPQKDSRASPFSSARNHQENGNHGSPAGSGSNSSASPAASNNGPSSSCCTSPDPIDSWLREGIPKKSGGESQSAANSTPGLTNAKTPSSDATNFDWLTSQNEGSFDPVLFGDYRDSQDAIVGEDAFTSGFFDDSFGLPDLNDSFFNTATDETIPARVTQTPKPNLMQQVAQQRDEDVEPPKKTEDHPSPPNLMTCHKIWNQLQDCPKFKTGDFDVDSLCAELSSKAKCTETGMGVPKDAVEAALWKLAGKETTTSQVDTQNKKA